MHTAQTPNPLKLPIVDDMRASLILDYYYIIVIVDKTNERERKKKQK